MTINDSGRFIYANQSSDEFGVMIAYFGSSDTNSNDEVFNIITSTTPFIDTWHSHGKIKSEPLKFPITIVKQEGGYFDTNEERAIKKWLIKDERNWLQIDQEDMADIMYFSHLTFNRKENVARNTAGLVFDVTCDAPYAWSGLRKKSYTSTTTLNFSINSVVDFDKYIIYPQIIVTPLASGTCKIKNNTTNETVEFTNCVSTEVITLDCKSDKISSTGRTMINNWNKQTLSIAEGINNMNIEGNFKLEILYRLPIRVGG